MAGRAFMVTGTDTSIGKTEVACAVARGLVARGTSVGVYKPAETGVPRIDGEPLGEDCVRLSKAAGGSQPPGEVASYLFDLPAAPLVSAEAENATIDTRRFATDLAGIRDAHEITVVEGAGGLLVPISEGYTFAELARDLRLPVLVVVGSRLGCINHALLTLEVLAARGLATLGYVINRLGDSNDDTAAAQSNRDIIGRFSDARDLGVLPYVSEAARADDGAALWSDIDLDAIVEGSG